MKSAVLIAGLLTMVVACSPAEKTPSLSPTPTASSDAAAPSNQVRPLSKVTVENTTADWRYVRMNWADGLVQVFRVEPGAPHYLSGAIGTSGFPLTINVLNADCEALATVMGLAPGGAGLLTIGADGARLDEIEVGDPSWGVTGGVFACGATPGSLPP